jgi:hypothetical protein
MPMLSNTEARRTVKLLGVLQDNLESSIESSVHPDTNEPDPEDAGHVAADRKLWRQAENLIKRLTKGVKTE